jgi:hypothetical protein
MRVVPYGELTVQLVLQGLSTPHQNSTVPGTYLTLTSVSLLLLVQVPVTSDDELRLTVSLAEFPGVMVAV